MGSAGQRVAVTNDHGLRVQRNRCASGTGLARTRAGQRVGGGRAGPAPSHAAASGPVASPGRPVVSPRPPGGWTPLESRAGWGVGRRGGCSHGDGLSDALSEASGKMKADPALISPNKGLPAGRGAGGGCRQVFYIKRTRWNMGLVREPRKPLSCTWCLRGLGPPTRPPRPAPRALRARATRPVPPRPWHSLSSRVGDGRGRGTPKGPSPESHASAGSSGRLAAALTFIANLR